MTPATCSGRPVRKPKPRTRQSENDNRELEEIRLQSAEITKLALGLEAAQSLGEWSDTADALVAS
jgi:hypothetical protein